jgi:putative ABC transport system substrate-binding protein
MELEARALLDEIVVVPGLFKIDIYRRLGGITAKVLHGSNPADLPVERPTKFEFSINMRTAKAIGLTVPGVLLMRADEVIQ